MHLPTYATDTHTATVAYTSTLIVCASMQGAIEASRMEVQAITEMLNVRMHVCTGCIYVRVVYRQQYIYSI